MRAAAALAIGLLLWVTVRGHDGYDLAYALLWGEELFHGHAPSLRAPLAPTPHPLTNLLGFLVAPLGRPAGADAFRLVIELSLGAAAVAAFDVGRRLFDSIAAGLLAAAVIVTRPALVAGALRGSIDIPALALTLFALDALLRRRWTTTLILLAVAGLLRPEAWLLSVVVAAWWLWSERPAKPAGVVALALAAPLVWCGADLLVTGDPLFSLTGTRTLAEELGRTTGASHAPLLVPRLLESVIGLTVLLAGALALLALSERPSKHFKATLAVLVLALATFVVIGAAGLPLLARYLLPAAAVLAILGAGVAVTPSPLVLRILTIACLVAALPATITGLDDAVGDSRERRALQADLRALAPHLRDACRPLSAVTYRHVPIIAYAAGIAPAAIHPRPDGASIVLPRSARAAESLQSASDDTPLLLSVPPGFRLTAQTRDWALAQRC